VLISGVCPEEEINRMKAIIGFCALALTLGSIAEAATISTTLTVNGTGTLSGTAVTATGTATMPNVYSGSAAFAGSLPLSGISGSNVVGTFTITPSTGGTTTGTLSVPLSLFESLLEGGSSGSGTGSAAITGGSGSYSGYTGSFPSVSGSGTSATNGGFTLTLTGPGTVNTAGGATTTPTPTITAVQDAAANTPSIAEGSIFIVKGTNLSASGFNEFSVPYPTSSNGIQIALTPSSGGAATNAYLIYLYNQSGVNQLAGILPSTLAAGNYTLTVTNNTGSVTAPFPVTVVAHKPGLFTQDSSGTGLAVVQNYISASELDIDRFTTGSVSGVTISPAKPGQTLIAWATGLGPITTPDNAATGVINFLPGLNVQVIVGGVSITPSFAGLAGYPGEAQINFTLPASIPTGCTESFQVSVNGILSNATFISVAPSASANACVAPGLTTSQLQSLDNGGTLTAGGFDLEQFSANVNEGGQTISENLALVAGGFTQVSGYQLASSTVITFQPGVCQVIQTTASTTSQTPVVTPTSVVNLDAGAIALTGPSASNINNAPLTETSNTYNLTITEQVSGVPNGVSLPGIPNASITAGTYTLKGAGGKDVGPFTASITLGSPLTLTGGLPTTVNRSAGLILNWTGGNSTDLVEIFGSVGGATSNSSFACITTAGPGTFTVPASILDQLPAVSAAAIAAGTSGILGVFSTPNPASGNGFFSAPLTAGGSITNATFLALIGVEGTAVFQ
jgi:uncharacterized protein (TIGR03437 family)